MPEGIIIACVMVYIVIGMAFDWWVQKVEDEYDPSLAVIVLWPVMLLLLVIMVVVILVVDMMEVVRFARSLRKLDREDEEAEDLV